MTKHNMTYLYYFKNHFKFGIVGVVTEKSKYALYT